MEREREKVVCWFSITESTVFNISNTFLNFFLPPLKELLGTMLVVWVEVPIIQVLIAATKVIQPVLVTMPLLV